MGQLFGPAPAFDDGWVVNDCSWANQVLTFLARYLILCVVQLHLALLPITAAKMGTASKGPSAI